MLVLYGILGVLLCAFVIYFVGYGFVGLFKKIRCPKESSHLHHFAVVIPARNESMVIGNLLDSLKEMDYPENLYDVYAIINSCTDDTEKVVREHGAHVLKCEKPVHSKGDVLAFAFGELLKKDPSVDAFVIFDADNVVDPEFLKEMNASLEEGNAIAQGRRVGKNSQDDTLSGCYELFYNTQNLYFNHARYSTGHSCSLNGTGWMVTAKWLEKNGFHMVTLTEDLELASVAALEHEKIGYVHKAKTYDEYPASMKMTWRELFRWIFGQVQCLRTYGFRLLKGTLKGGFSCLDMGLIMSAPLILIIGMIFLVMTIWMPASWPQVFQILRRWMWVLPLLAYAFMVCVEFLGLFKVKMKIGKYVKSVFVFPFFMMIWLPITFVCLFRRNVTWKPIEHDRSVRIEDMK